MSKGRRFDEPRLNIKKVLGVLICIIVVIMVIVSIVKLVKNHQETNQITATAYFVALENNKWGVIDNKGNTIYGLINFKGEKILDTIYDEIDSLKGVKNSLIIKKDGNVGVCSNYGTIIADTKYKDIKALGNTYENGYIIVTTDNKYGIIGIDKSIILEPTYEQINYIGNNVYYSVKISGKSYLIDSTTKTTSQIGFDQ